VREVGGVYSLRNLRIKRRVKRICESQGGVKTELEGGYHFPGLFTRRGLVIGKGGWTSLLRKMLVARGLIRPEGQGGLIPLLFGEKGTGDVSTTGELGGMVCC